MLRASGIACALRLRTCGPQVLRGWPVSAWPGGTKRRSSCCPGARLPPRTWPCPSRAWTAPAQYPGTAMGHRAWEEGRTTKGIRFSVWWCLSRLRIQASETKLNRLEPEPLTPGLPSTWRSPQPRVAAKFHRRSNVQETPQHNVLDRPIASASKAKAKLEQTVRATANKTNAEQQNNKQQQQQHNNPTGRIVFQGTGPYAKKKKEQKTKND